MRLTVDKTGKKFVVAMAPEEKTDPDGKQRVDRRTNEPLWTTQLAAFDDTGVEKLVVTTAGQPPKVNVEQVVDPVELEAIPWVQGSRYGTAFRAKSITPVSVSAAKAA